VVSINHRNEGPLEKRYDDTNVDWRPVERKLGKWRNLVRMGRTPQIAITVKYMRDDDAAKACDKQGSSATKRMLAERDAVVTAEEESNQPSSWRYVYKLMRCSVNSCSNVDKWCWQDPKGRKHYSLRKPHLMKLISYVDAGGKLDSHDDVPKGIRQALYVEAQQKLERGSNKQITRLLWGLHIQSTSIFCLRRVHMSLLYPYHHPNLRPRKRESRSLGLEMMLSRRTVNGTNCK
jgi:hypothetical protein